MERGERWKGGRDGRQGEVDSRDRWTGESGGQEGEVNSREWSQSVWGHQQKEDWGLGLLNNSCVTSRALLLTEPSGVR